MLCSDIRDPTKPLRPAIACVSWASRWREQPRASQRSSRVFLERTLRFPFAQVERPHAIPDFRGRFGSPAYLPAPLVCRRVRHARGPLSQVERHPAVLTLLIPAESAIGNRLGRQILKATEQGVVLRNFECPTPNRDSYQSAKGPEKGGGCGHD
jgi:hypothetical protein